MISGLNSFVMRVGSPLDVAVFYQHVLSAQISPTADGQLIEIGGIQINVLERDRTPTIVAGRRNLEDLHVFRFDWDGTYSTLLRHLQNNGVGSSLTPITAPNEPSRRVGVSFRDPEGLLLEIYCREEV